jgi:hypothetical protein
MQVEWNVLRYQEQTQRKKMRAAQKYPVQCRTSGEY